MLSHNKNIHARANHIELDIHCVHERVVTNKLNIQHVHCPKQITYALAKQS